MTTTFHEQKIISNNIIPNNYQDLLNSLRVFNSKSELYQSSFYQQNSNILAKILNHIWEKHFTSPKVRLKEFLRLVHWNIERGKHLEAIIELFNADPILQFADIISLNEVDLGMNRTQNRNIAFELGQRLGMHTVYIPEYLELTKGIGEELTLAGENKEALHGNAILSRYPILAVHSVRLPSCFDTYQFSEKRFGERVALIVEIEVNKQIIYLVNTHLEVRNTPKCRAKQFQSILQALEKLPLRPTIIAGDLNVGTFKRGNFYYSFLGFLRLVFNSPEKLAYELRHPEKYEPLFDYAKKHGFAFEAYNDDLVTCATSITGVDEAKEMPTFLQSRIDRRLAPYNNRLEFRLDYIFARGIKALKANEIINNQTTSINPTTITNLLTNGEQISDHTPIVCDFRI
ncbi:MAG: endonuclease/exonuclease/phosphatase family protein [Blastocatellia bacterium]